MISPEKLDKLPTEMISLIQQLQEEIISDICRRVAKTGYLTATAEWELVKANQLRLSEKEVNSIIARQLGVCEKTVSELYTDTVKQALLEDAEIYRAAAEAEKLPSDTGEKIKSYFRSHSLSKALSKGLKNSKGQIRSLCNSMAAQANRELSDAMDLAHLKVISGAFSYSDAVYSAVKSLADSGITRVEYPSGRKDNADVCVRRAVLSSMNKTACDIQLDMAQKMNSELVEVSSHFGARPSHAAWQGKIYSLSRDNKKYPYFYDATGYGTGAGLGGWNCRHNFYPFFEGISYRRYYPYDEEKNAGYYALTQKQRSYERAVRDSKRQLAAIDGARQATDDPQLKAKLDNDFARRSVILKNRENRLNEFINSNEGLHKDNSRVRVAGFGKSTSQKAVWAEKKKSANGLTTANAGSIIKENGMYRKKSDSFADNKYISDKRFNDLIIEAKKSGAKIIRDEPWFNKRLEEQNASAVTYGDVIVFRKNVTVSDVLEETYHFKQNMQGLNNDKSRELREALNEIDAKQYLIDNEKKYSIPRNETEITKKQLEYYKKIVEELTKGK